MSEEAIRKGRGRTCVAKRWPHIEAHHLCRRERWGLRAFTMISIGKDSRQRNRLHTHRLVALSFDLAICPSRNFDVKVDNVVLLLVGIKRNVVPERDDFAILLEPNAPILLTISKYPPQSFLYTYQCVARSNFSQTESIDIEFLLAILVATLCGIGSCREHRRNGQIQQTKRQKRTHGERQDNERRPGLHSLLRTTQCNWMSHYIYAISIAKRIFAKEICGTSFSGDDTVVLHANSNSLHM